MSDVLRQQTVPVSKWEGTDSEGTDWMLEVETDCFTEEDGHVVSVWIEDKHSDGKQETGLATLSPDEARQAGAALLWWADNCEMNRKRCA